MVDTTGVVAEEAENAPHAMVDAARPSNASFLCTSLSVDERFQSGSKVFACDRKHAMGQRAPTVGDVTAADLAALLAHGVFQDPDAADLQLHLVAFLQPRSLRLGQFQQAASTDRARADHVARHEHDGL